MSDFYCFFMSKIAKKKKSDKVNLAVKVHSSSLPQKRKKVLSSVPEGSKKSKKIKKVKKENKPLKRRKLKKNKGFLEKEELKKKKEFKKELGGKRYLKFPLVSEDSTEYNYKEEKAKNLLMKSGVTFFMLLIFMMWVYNTKRSIVNSVPESVENNILEPDSWQNLSGGISEKMSEIKNLKTKIESETIEGKENKEKMSKSSVSSNNPINISPSSEQIEKLKEEIDKRIDNQ